MAARVCSRLLSVDQGIMVQDIQETTGRRPAQIKGYAEQLAQRLFPRRARPAWYTRWWIWTAAAVAIGATVGLTTWAATRGSPEDSNVIRIGDL